MAGGRAKQDPWLRFSRRTRNVEEYSAGNDGPAWAEGGRIRAFGEPVGKTYSTTPTSAKMPFSGGTGPRSPASDHLADFFSQAHWDVLAAVDFTTVEVWTKNGLVRFYLLFVMELATRRVHFAGSTTSPAEVRMKQVARNLTDAEGGFLNGKRYILMDRDAKFSARLPRHLSGRRRRACAAAAAIAQPQCVSRSSSCEALRENVLTA